MSTAPPLAVDRLIGLAGASKNLVGCMEKGKLPLRMDSSEIEVNLAALCRIIVKLLDTDIFPWLEKSNEPTDHERFRAATIVADRLCSAVANDFVGRARKYHQLAVVAEYLESRGYREVRHPPDQQYTTIMPGCYEMEVNVPILMGPYDREPFDILIRPHGAPIHSQPILLDVRSSSASTDADAKKLRSLRMTYGASINYVLLLGGKFNPGSFGTQAAEGLDWIWQHRVNDLGRLVH